MPAPEPTGPFAATIRALEATEANLEKAERAWAGMARRIPQGPAYGDDPEYDVRRRTFVDLLGHLPAIDGWKPADATASINDIAQWRIDAADVDQPACYMQVEEMITQPGRDLAEYRFRFDRKRRALTRGAARGLLDEIDGRLRAVDPAALDGDRATDRVEADLLASLRERVTQLDALLGSSVRRPPRWGDLQRHLHYGLNGDLRDIIRNDWPVVQPAVTAGLYGEDDPLPTGVGDLAELTPSSAGDRIPAQLRWDRLTPDDFERLIFALVGAAPGYENPALLTRTYAPDGGRDVSADRVVSPALSQSRRERVIVQCKHWSTRSVAPADMGEAKEQMLLWTAPPVDVLVIATTGRFTTDAVKVIEAHNYTRPPLRVEMWPESHLERELAAHPALIAEFQLR